MKLSRIVTVAVLVVALAVAPVIMTGCGETADEGAVKGDASSKQAEVKTDEDAGVSEEAPKFETVSFKNPAIEEYVRSFLRISADEAITTKDTATMRAIELSGEVGTDFSDLELFENLGGLGICDTSLTDISLVLKHCSNIETFYLANNQSVTDLSAIANNSSILYFSSSSSACKDLSAVGTLKQLEGIKIIEQEISDYSFLNGNTSLKSVSLVKAGTFDATALSNLTELIQIDVRETALASNDFSFAKNLSNLSEMSFRSCGISDISSFPSASLSSLSKLNLAGNSIADVTALATLPAVRELDLSWNKISDVSPLKEITDTVMRHGINVDKNPAEDNLLGMDDYF